jgi:aminoglycoside phosphotransferase (APT) family kinase protein
VDTLVTLHAVEPEAVGLVDFGRPDGFLQRQVRRWHTQWQASRSEPRAHLDEVVALLADTLPPQSRPGVVHGDYRLTNVMFRPDLSAIAAVVDWEMATLGDPLTDVGLLVVYQGLARENGLIVPMMRPESGFWTPEQMVQRYAAGSDRDLSHLPWYVAFGCFKLAVVAEGIHFRFLQGKTVGAGFDQVGQAVPALLERALGILTA